MNPVELIHRFYASQPQLEELLLTHSRQVTDRALRICDAHPELHLDRTFIYEAAMLHDIGIIQTNAPSIYCYGTQHYIRHGIIGAEMLQQEGMPRHARVAERHTGTGITIADIEARHLPLPLQDYSPETMEEQLICYADKFYSKTKLGIEKTFEQALHSLFNFGSDSVERFEHWHKIFST